MAEVTNVKMEEVVVKPAEYTLVLTEDEAQLVRTILYRHVIGDTDTDIRKASTNISKALREAGVFAYKPNEGAQALHRHRIDVRDYSDKRIDGGSV